MSLPIAILAGGLGTRLKPITQTIPKALVPISGRPFLSYQLELLRHNGITKVVLCVGYLGEMIEEEFGNGASYGVEIQYAYDGPTLLGTGGALLKALHLLKSSFFILYGDSYLPIDFQAVSKSYQASKKLGLMSVFKNKGSWDTSNVFYSNGKINVYDKKNRIQEMEHIDYGLSILSPDAFKGFPEDGPFDLADVFQSLIKKEQLAGFEVFKRFYEVGSPTGLKEFEELVGNGKQFPYEL